MLFEKLITVHENLVSVPLPVKTLTYRGTGTENPLRNVPFYEAKLFITSTREELPSA